MFYTASLKHPFWLKFYGIVLPLLLCYFMPGLFNTFRIIWGKESKLYPVVSQYLLPACLVLIYVRNGI
ncbi:DUF819 family protein [Runella slithyformis]|uniref:DUF819 family protein n=1 Tax=Runella slithyformis TaxID=106 RepID=UPI0021D01A5F|nr:DUF819 family protein [Runella slithyformis]